VIAVGPDVRDFAVGDRVTAPFVHGCGRCNFCRAGEAQVCPFQTQPGFTHPGSWAEQVAVLAANTNLVRLPDGLDFAAAAALGCRFATAYRALTVHGRVRAGDWVAVFGCGGVGLSTVLIATALGARVVAVDVSPTGLGQAEALGAEVCVRATPDLDPSPAVHRATGGGARLSVDAYGSAATLDASVRSLGRRGRHLQVGLLGADRAAALPWDLVIGRELEIYGSHGMPAVDYPGMLDLICRGILHPELLVGRVIRLEDAPAALMGMDAPAPVHGGTTVIAIPARPPA
jgi:alcohol dehydrogenase